MHQYQNFYQKPQKLFQNNNQDHEQFQNQFVCFLQNDFVMIQKSVVNSDQFSN